MNGIINIYKEKGYTSHDVVAKLRGILKQKKIGHTGTLDPDAIGVLPVCLGNATKVCDLLTDKDKTYETVLKLGIETDTQDMTGNILEKKEVAATEENIVHVIQSFIGEYNQVPPMYSALKVNGKKLYELAREGKVIERKPRQVVIYDIVIKNINMQDKEVAFSVSCSKGTYIRTLCHDIGERLGCGGCMKTLIRTKAGMFEIADSITLEQVADMQKKETLAEKILAVDAVFSEKEKMFSKFCVTINLLMLVLIPMGIVSPEFLRVQRASWLLFYMLLTVVLKRKQDAVVGNVRIKSQLLGMMMALFGFGVLINYL